MARFHKVFTTTIGVGYGASSLPIGALGATASQRRSEATRQGMETPRFTGLVWKIFARDFETVSRCCPAKLTSIFARRLSGFTFEKDAHVFRVFEAGKLCDRFQGEISFR